MTVANVGASADNVFTTSVANAASLSGHVLVSCHTGSPGWPAPRSLLGPGHRGHSCHSPAVPCRGRGVSPRSGGRRAHPSPATSPHSPPRPRGGGRPASTHAQLSPAARPGLPLVTLQVPLAPRRPCRLTSQCPPHVPHAPWPPTLSRSGQRLCPQPSVAVLQHALHLYSRGLSGLGALSVSGVHAGVGVSRKWTVPGNFAGPLKFSSASMGCKVPDGKVAVF